MPNCTPPNPEDPEGGLPFNQNLGGNPFGNGNNHNTFWVMVIGIIAVTTAVTAMTISYLHTQGGVYPVGVNQKLRNFNDFLIFNFRLLFNINSFSQDNFENFRTILNTFLNMRPPQHEISYFLLEIEDITGYKFRSLEEFLEYLNQSLQEKKLLRSPKLG